MKFGFLELLASLFWHLVIICCHSRGRISGSPSIGCASCHHSCCHLQCHHSSCHFSHHCSSGCFSHLHSSSCISRCSGRSLYVFVLDWFINKLSCPDVYQEPYHPLWWVETSGKSPFSFTPSTSSSIPFSPLWKLQWWCFVVLQTCLAKRSSTNLLPDFTILFLAKCNIKCTIWHNNFWNRIICPTK